jgi:hypothetical protein
VVGARGAYRRAVGGTPTWRGAVGDEGVRVAPAGSPVVVAGGAGPFQLGVSTLPKASGCLEGRG